MDAHMQAGRLDARIAALADANHGIVDVDGLHSVGASRTQIGRRIDAGRLIPLHRGVYAVGHRRLRPRGWWLAAVWAIGPGAVLSHAHATALWNLREPPGGRVHVTVPSRGRRPRADIRVHATRHLPPAHTTVHDRIPVTTVARTLSDLAGTAEPAALARAVEAAEALRLLDGPATLAAASGRPGAARLAQLLATEPDHTRSEFEAAMVVLCRRHGLGPPRTNAVVAGHLVDCHWPAQRVVAELDSWRFHNTRAAFERDRARDADLQALGFAAFRFTYPQVTRRPAWVASRLRPLLG
jgi:very-short-patch-repair endonuclease